jgi:uncharacterized protein (TIGR03663 family)
MGMEKRGTVRITVEAAAYAGVALLAAWLRWSQLGHAPLREGEAASALAAFRFIHGAAEAAPEGGLPALFTGNVAGFALLGAGDAVARWLPALAGMALVLLPYGLRRWLGRGGALAASFLLAISPSAVYFSRTLDASTLVAVCGLTMAVGFLNYLETHDTWAVCLAAGALGLGLCAGPAFYTVLLVFAAFALALYLVERLRKHESGWSAVREAWQALAGSRGTAVTAGATLAAVFGLVATSFALHSTGVSQAVDLVGEWVRSFGKQAGGQPPGYPLLLLLRYEPLILILGLAEAARAGLGARPRGQDGADPVPGTVHTRFPHTGFLAFWALAALLIAVLSGHRPAGNVLLAVVPLALLAGQGIERTWRWMASRSLWPAAVRVAAIAVAITIFLYLQATAFALADGAATVLFLGTSLPTGTAYLLLALLALLLLVALGAAAWIWRGREVVFAGGWLALLVVLSLWSFRSSWRLTHSHRADPRELMIAQATAPEVRPFVQQVERLSLDRAGDPHTLPITVDAATGPVIAWYLREFERQDAVEGLKAPPATLAAVTLARQDLPIGEAFQGTAFPLQISWRPEGLNLKALVRWLLFDSASQPAVDQQVVLWVAAQANGQ